MSPLPAPSDHNHGREGALLIAALDLPPAERGPFLDRECAGDSRLRARLDRLLQAHAEAPSFLTEPALGRAAQNLRPTVTAGSDPDIGTDSEPSGRIGRYKLLQKLGEGGFGIVWMAEQEEPVRRRVALKILKTGMDTRSVIARFEAERQALALMDHPNIAKVLDAGETPAGRPYFVMELVRGVRITEFCDTHQLPTSERLKLYVQVCHAVQHAHQKGVIHRDLKPSNILVTSHDGVPVPKVIDFGIAKATQQPLTDKTVFTQFQQFLGTPAYMSPEQTEMSGLDIDTRSDIYTLGVLLYELLTGGPPFDPKTLLQSGFEEMRRIIREQDPPRPSTRLSTLQADALGDLARLRHAEAPRLVHLVRGDLDWIVMKALEKDRTRRYETANGLALDIERHLKNEPVLARPPSASYRVRKFVRRNRVVVFATTSILAVLLLGSVISAWQAFVATRARDRALEAERREAAQHREAEAAGEHARESERTALHNLYVANLNLVQQDYAQGNLGRIRQSLEQVRDHPSRGFEWSYWQRAIRRDLRTFYGQSSDVYGLAFSPDGQLLAASDAGQGTVVWETETGVERFRVPDAIARLSTSFSSDGRWFATAGPGQVARIWDTATWQLHLAITNTRHFVATIAFAPDGRHLATGGNEDTRGTVKLWDFATGRLVCSGSTNHAGPVTVVRFSPDGTRLVSGSWDGTARIWTAADGAILRTFDARGGWVYDASFSPDGRRLLTAHFGDRTVRVWNMESGREVLRPLRHIQTVFCAAFSPDGHRIYTAGWEAQVRVWDAETGEALPPLPKGHIAGITGLAVSADGRRIATGGWDEDVKLWSTEHDESTPAFAVRLWPRDWEEARLYDYLHGPCVFPDVSGTNALVLVPAPDFSVQGWNLASRRKRFVLTGHTNRITSLAVSRDHTRIATGSEDERAIVWDAQTLQPLFSVGGHTYGVKSVAFSNDGKQFVTTGGHRTTQVWDASNGRPLPCTIRHPAWVHDARFSPDDRWIATIDDEQTAIWEASSGSLVRTLGNGGALCLAWSPDGRRIATGNFRGQVRVWDAASGQQVAECRGHIAPVFAITFSPDGERTASGAWNGDTKLWETRTGRELLTLHGHSNYVLSVAFSSDGLRIYTGSEDQTARVWEAASDAEVAAWQEEERSARERVARRAGAAQTARKISNTNSADGTAPSTP